MRFCVYLSFFLPPSRARRKGFPAKTRLGNSAFASNTTQLRAGLPREGGLDAHSGPTLQTVRRGGLVRGPARTWSSLWLGVSHRSHLGRGPRKRKRPTCGNVMPAVRCTALVRATARTWSSLRFSASHRSHLGWGLRRRKHPTCGNVTPAVRRAALVRATARTWSSHLLGASPGSHLELTAV